MCIDTVNCILTIKNRIVKFVSVLHFSRKIHLDTTNIYIYMHRILLNCWYWHWKTIYPVKDHFTNTNSMKDNFGTTILSHRIRNGWPPYTSLNVWFMFKYGLWGGRDVKYSIRILLIWYIRFIYDNELYMNFGKR